MGKSTISMAIFHCFLLVHQRVFTMYSPCIHQQFGVPTKIHGATGPTGAQFLECLTHRVSRCIVVWHQTKPGSTKRSLQFTLGSQRPTPRKSNMTTLAELTAMHRKRCALLKSHALGKDGKVYLYIYIYM